MYKVNLQVQVMDGRDKESSTKSFYAVNEIELPFVPFSNLSLVLGDSANWKGCWLIKEVFWALQSETFTCNCEDKTLDLLSVDQLMYDDWLTILPSWGWRIIPQN